MGLIGHADLTWSPLGDKGGGVDVSDVQQQNVNADNNGSTTTSRPIRDSHIASFTQMSSG